MKRPVLLFVWLVIWLPVSLLPVDEVTLKDGVDYLETLDKNDVYFKIVMDVDYENGLLYFLEFKYSKVIVVDAQTATLKRSLFRRGQGPYELMTPVSLKVKNNKVFVLDQGFNGIKIVDVEGNPVNEFKTAGMLGRRNLDVNDSGEIFVGEYSTPDKTYVSVYDREGKKLRSLVKIDGEKAMPPERMLYRILVDKEGNILVLFPVLRELKKFNPKGELTWETKLNNKLLDQGTADDGVHIKKSGAIKVRMSVFDMLFTPGNDILVGHDAGGCIIDGAGKLTGLIDMVPMRSLFMVVIFDNKLLNVLVGGHEMSLYDIKEVIK